ncbi:MAG: hypothetical protein AABY95_07750 [Pseudomonadota bacterium]
MTTTIKLWLPNDLKRFMGQKVREGGYISGPEYVRDLVRQHRRRIIEDTPRMLIRTGKGASQ